MKADWSYNLQGSEHERRVMTAGSELSKYIGCGVHYPAFDKNVFECECGITFMFAAVEGALLTGNWNSIIKRHTEGLIAIQQKRFRRS